MGLCMKKKADIDKLDDMAGVVDTSRPIQMVQVEMDELKKMLRSEMERFLFSNVCDDMKDEEEANSGFDSPEPEEDIQVERTQQEADRASKKRLKKIRDGWRKDIKKKREQRQKCRKQSVKEQNVFNRWKELVFG